MKFILIVDPDGTYANALASHFPKDHFRFTILDSALQAMSALESQEFHVVISDENPSDLGGLEFLAIAKEKVDSKITTIIYAEAPTQDDIRAASKAQINHFYAKISNSNLLASKIIKSLGNSSNND